MSNEDNLTRNISYAIYIMYLSSIIIPMLPILAVIFAYIFENDARDTLRSHYQYCIRSFWIALLYFGLSATLIPVIIGIPMMTLCVIWWIIRNVKGLKALMRDEPYHNPTTWLF